jgi:hypothetical protein
VIAVGGVTEHCSRSCWRDQFPLSSSCLRPCCLAMPLSMLRISSRGFLNAEIVFVCGKLTALIIWAGAQWILWGWEVGSISWSSTWTTDGPWGTDFDPFGPAPFIKFLVSFLIWGHLDMIPFFFLYVNICWNRQWQLLTLYHWSGRTWMDWARFLVLNLIYAKVLNAGCYFMAAYSYGYGFRPCTPFRLVSVSTLAYHWPDSLCSVKLHDLP